MQIYSIRKMNNEPIKSNKVSQVKIKDQAVNIATVNNLKEYTDLIEDLKKECFDFDIKNNEIILYDKAEVIENFINFSIRTNKRKFDCSPFAVSYKIFKNGQFSEEHRYIDGNIKTKILGNIFRDNNDDFLWQTAREIYNKHWGDE